MRTKTTNVQPYDILHVLFEKLDIDPDSDAQFIFKGKAYDIASTRTFGKIGLNSDSEITIKTNPHEFNNDNYLFNNNLQEKLNDEILKNKNLEQENRNLKSMLNKNSQYQNIEINQLKAKIENYQKENNKLKDDLLKVNKLLLNMQNNNELRSLREEKEYLKNQLNIKELEINNLKLKLENKNSGQKKYNFDDMMILHFKSTDQIIDNVVIKCLKNETFAEIEERLYKKFPDFRNSNNTLICNGAGILRFKTLSENNIKDEDVITLIKIE
jgi:hypothetical protein